MSQFYAIKGQTSTFNIVATRNGVPVNLSGASLVFGARQSPSSGSYLISKSIGFGIVVTDAPNGLATLTILGSDTSGLALEQQFLYYQLILNAGSGPETIGSGTLQIAVDTTPFLYVSVAEIRALGLTDTAMFPDSAILSSLKTWQAFIERACRQWFYPLELELNLDGTDSDAIHFGVPVISISEVRLNGDATALDPRYYRVYNALQFPADKQNPRLKLIEQRSSNYDIYTAPLRDGKLMFRFGRQNQYIKGVFGCIEAGGSAPELIKRALSKLVVEKLSRPLFIAPGTDGPPPPPLLAGIVLEEWTDGHKIKYGQSGGELKPRAPGLAGITDDQEVLNILKLYKAPIGVATPNNPSGR